MNTPLANRILSGLLSLLPLALGVALTSLWWTWPTVEQVAGPLLLDCSLSARSLAAPMGPCEMVERLFWLMHHLIPLAGLLLVWIVVSSHLRRTSRH